MKKIENTTGLCPECLRPVPAEIIEKDGGIYLRKTCPQHGPEETLISSDGKWYNRVMSFSPRLETPLVRAGAAAKDCPLDCGFCASHQQRMFLPVVPVTSACNLDCPVCYTINKNKNAYFMSTDQFAVILERIREHDPGMSIINFTGGEPLCHPRFDRLVEMCREAGIHRITVSTNGLAFLENEALLERLTELGTRIVLSFNSFRPEPYRATAGRDLLEKKLAILRLLEKYKPVTTLLTVAGAGLNDGETGEIVRYVTDSDYIVSSEIHTVTYTGGSKHRFEQRARLTVPCVLSGIAAGNPGISMNDFLPSPCAHPLCYSICYLLRDGEAGWIPFTRFMTDEQVYRMMTGSLYMEPSAEAEAVFREVIDTAWSDEVVSPVKERALGVLRDLLRRGGNEGGWEAAEKVIKAIYIHSHMDAGNFDVRRVKQCCVAVPDGEGHCIPTCAYNNIYRARDPRFSIEAGEKSPNGTNV